MANIAEFRKKYQWWVTTFLLLNILILFLAFTSDPYRLNPIRITIPGINDIKPRLYDSQRYVKLFDIAYEKPKTVILGSSRVLFGIDPQNSLLKKYPPVYNAGILGAPMHEIHGYFLHALANQPDLKRVVLALDFYEFNAKFDNNKTGAEDLYQKNWLEMLMSRKDLVFDLRGFGLTIWDSLSRKNVKSIREDGRLIPDPLSNREVYKDFFGPANVTPSPLEASKQIPAQKIVIKKSLKSAPKVVNAPAKKVSMKNELYQPFQLSKIDMDALKDIVEICKKKNIELYIYLPPIYLNTEITAFHDMNIWQDYRTFQRYIAHLHPFWDFTGWNEISMTRENFVDGSHHVFPVGNMVLERIFGANDKNIPRSFGHYVTNKNVVKHLDVMEKEYRAR